MKKIKRKKNLGRSRVKLLDVLITTDCESSSVWQNDKNVTILPHTSLDSSLPGNVSNLLEEQLFFWGLMMGKQKPGCFQLVPKSPA